MTAAKFLALSMCLLGAAIGISHSAEPVVRGDDPRAVRKALVDINGTWSRARVAYDRAAFERLLAPDFYVALADQRIGRADFIAHISEPTSPGRLLRFDNQVMTLAHRPERDEWVAVVVGKMEWEPAAQGAAHPPRLYGMWTTREGYRLVDSRWQLTFTEELGSEYWSDGQKPPFADW